MSVNVIAELHPIKRDRVQTTTESKSIAQIIRDLNTGFPLSQARVCRNGEIVTDFSITANDGDDLAIKFVPHGSNEGVGIGMKVGGWGLVLAGIASLIFLGWTGVGGVLGSALIGTGLSLTLGGTVLLNVNIPSFKDREKPENDPSIRGGKNQMRQYGRIPVLFGRHRIYPDLAANPHTSIIGNQQFFTQLFCGGYKDYVIDKNSFKLGETYLKDLSQTKDIKQILSGADPVVSLEILQDGEGSKLYPHCVHEDAVNAPLQNQTEDADGNKIPGELIRTTPDNTDTINVDIFFYNGLGKYGNSGGIGSTSVDVKASYKPFGADDSKYTLLGYFNNGSNTIFGSELKTKRCQITRDGLPIGRYTVKIERVTPDSADNKIIDQVYVGSIRSIKSKDKDGNVVRPIRAERQRELTVIALRVLSTAQMNGILDSFNYVATAKMPVYSGAGSGSLYWLAVAETRNPASALLYALQGRAAQQGVDPGDIDWPSLEAFYTWCEQKENNDYKYTCDAYLSESVTIAELMRMIGSTARADILRIDSKISVVQDIKRSSHVQLFTPKNSIAYSIAMFNADIPDAIALRFIDEDAGYAQSELQVHNTPDGNPAAGAGPDTVQKADLWGVTNSKQARRIGMYKYACIKNRPFVHTIEVDIEYLLCNKGDWIQYAGDIALAGSTQGRIKGVIREDGVCIGIDTDEPMVMTGDKQYAVRIRRSDGTVILKDVALNLGKRHEKSITYYPAENEGLYEPFIGDMYAIDEDDNVYFEAENILFFIEPFKETDAPKAGDIYAFGVRGYEVIDLIITDIAPGQNLSAILTCVEYSPEIFGVDQSGFVLPDFVNRITPVSGAVDSGVVNLDRWRSFATHHDGEEEPARPSGDGQGDGWHHVETFRSVWQSTKVAESVESGEWGPPVRIRAARGTDDITPIWMSLSPQNVTLETDGNGNLFAGLLPLTAQARLFKWNSILTDVSFSLTGAPPGVSINPNGVITVSADASLGKSHAISVRAIYQGATYFATFLITKNVNNLESPYLGTTEALSMSSPTVIIIKGPAMGEVQAGLGDYVLAVKPVNGNLAGSVFQWGGAAWEYRAPQNYANLYISCFKDGLDVPALARDIGWFGGIFAGLICAQAGFIEELQTQVITLKEGGILQSEAIDPTTRKPLLSITKNGIEAIEGKFNKGKFDEGTFKDITVTGNSTVYGIIRGTLDGFNLVTLGAISAPVGTGFLFKADNNAVVILPFGGYEVLTLGKIYDYTPVKTIRVAASGSCTVRLKFPSVMDGIEKNDGMYKVTSDNGYDSGWQNYTVGNNYVALPSNKNTINLKSNGVTEIMLYGKTSRGGSATTGFINTAFEIWCDRPPGLLGLLG